MRVVGKGRWGGGDGWLGLGHKQTSRTSVTRSVRLAAFVFAWLWVLQPFFASFVVFRGFRDSNLPSKRPVEQRLEQVLGLALRLALLGAEPLELVDEVIELLLE